MTTELILIGVSFFVIFILFFVRYFNLAYSKNNNSKFLAITDRKIGIIGTRIRLIYTHTSRDIVDLIKDIPHIVLNILNKIFYKLYKLTKKLIDLIRGNKIKKDGGSVSIFLQKIEKE